LDSLSGFVVNLFFTFRPSSIILLIQDKTRFGALKTPELNPDFAVTFETAITIPLSYI
jgi:hypothetical protein